MARVRRRNIFFTLEMELVCNFSFETRELNGQFTKLIEILFGIYIVVNNSIFHLSKEEGARDHDLRNLAIIFRELIP